MIKKWGKRFFIFFSLLIASFWWFTDLPEPLFDSPYATVVKATNGDVLAGRIAEDGQWRFPLEDSVPLKFEQCILQFEDEYFYKHFGVNPVSIGKALYQNVKENDVKRGGSTLTMQLARLQQGNKERTYFQKFKEILFALRIEIEYSKKEILNLYASHAPFGGNVVGLESASRRYFGVAPSHLSWAQMATLAVLPNRPGLIYPGHGQMELRKKRDFLLSKLYSKGLIDSLQLDLALSVDLPQKPYPLSQQGKHLLNYLIALKGKGNTYETTIDGDLQRRAIEILKRRSPYLFGNKIYNASVVIIENETSNTLAYVGNLDSKGENGQEVDIVQSLRSTGSVLKPFLYVSMLSEGLLLPQQMVKDIPVYFNGFRPQNYNRSFDGVVRADMALARSLNVPAVILLNDYKVERFKYQLNQFGIRSINKPASYYGLSLILGGAESSLYQLAGAYSSMARVLNHYDESEIYRYSENDIRSPSVFQRKENETKKSEYGIVDAASVWYMFEAMSKVYRPEEDLSWQSYSSSNKIAWKTGTSYGHRDAWAFGVTPKYTVGVWVGNADGEGRPGLTGLEFAAPIMFDVFNVLPKSKFWKSPPLDEVTSSIVCNKTGFLASQNCPKTDTVILPIKCEKIGKNCPYHQSLYLNQEGKLSNAECYNGEIQKENYFHLPPIEAYYYRQKHSDYKQLPKYMNGCEPVEQKGVMQMIYPKSNASILIPKELSGDRGEVVFKVAHPSVSNKVFWYIDDEFVGKTQDIHHLSLQPAIGPHQLYLIDEEGTELTLSFSVKN